MNIDVESIKQAKDLLPENSRKQELNTAIESAERQLKIGESQTAQALKYELCRKHFPPEVMLSDDDKVWLCPVCNNKKDKRLYARSYVG